MSDEAIGIGPVRRKHDRAWPSDVAPLETPFYIKNFEEPWIKEIRQSRIHYVLSTTVVNGLLSPTRLADDECVHGRLPGDRTAPCGCFDLSLEESQSLTILERTLGSTPGRERRT